MNWRAGKKAFLPLAILAGGLFEFSLHCQSAMARGWETAFHSLHGLAQAGLLLWCGTLLSLAWQWENLFLIGLLSCALIGQTDTIHPVADALILLSGATFGKATGFWLRMADGRTSGHVWHDVRLFAWGVVGLLAVSSWLPLDRPAGYYHGPRWMGVWDDPNTYGMLMGTGITLAAGLLAGKPPVACLRRPLQVLVYFIPILLMGVGLLCSYSRGAWAGTIAGLSYLAWRHGQFNRRLVLPAMAVALVAAGLLWGRTPDSAPWYVKRADLGRPSAQHRAAAWRAGLEMMRDHPLGVGWNNAVKAYLEAYSPPEGAAAALATNDYLMLGTELGLPALACFVLYVAGHLRNGASSFNPPNLAGKTRTACQAGTLTLLVAFWFDCGLFKLPIALLFWVLLELGKHPHEKFRAFTGGGH